jgi:hypothetical protein
VQGGPVRAAGGEEGLRRGRSRRVAAIEAAGCAVSHASVDVVAPLQAGLDDVRADEAGGARHHHNRDIAHRGLWVALRGRQAQRDAAANLSEERERRRGTALLRAVGRDGRPRFHWAARKWRPSVECSEGGLQGHDGCGGKGAASGGAHV